MPVSRHTPPLTVEHIENMEARGHLCEIVHGQWVEATEEKMAGELHGAIATNLIMALGSYVKAHRLGRVYPADTTYILEEDQDGIQLMRLPDVSFVAADRLKTHDRETYYHLAPDLAIEIISPSERAVTMRAKLKDYLRTGVRQVWQVYPDTQEVVVYLPDGAVYTYTPGQMISGGDVLPGLLLPVTEIFAV
ncbi:MAG: Uma2 family endonuclease [Candidatus Tectimicrobiota bacterium]